MALNSAAAIRREPAADGSAASRADGSAASRFPVEQFTHAMETRDYDGVLRLCSPDFTFAPLGSSKLTFTGHARVRAMLAALLETCDVFQYTGEQYGSDDTVVLPLRATLGRRLEFQALDVLKIDEQGRATEMTVYGRSYMPVTVMVGRVGLRLIRPAGFLWWLPVRIFLYPLEWSQRISEPIGIRWAGWALEWALRRARKRHQKGRYT